MQAAETDYYASHSWNPFFFQGTKTFAYEVCEQLGGASGAAEWKAPDTVVLPAGNGTLLLGAEIGFRELLSAGLIDKMPRIIAVQSANCAPLAQAFAEESAAIPLIHKKETLAEGIAIAEPIRGLQIVSAVRRSAGACITVTEEQIRRSWQQMAAQGYYIEPTSAAVIAGVQQFIPNLQSGEVVVSVFTGHGLKSGGKE
jgi:threonine synthase